MQATKTVFVCQECGAQAPKWLGAAPSAARGIRSSRNVPPRRAAAPAAHRYALAGRPARRALYSEIDIEQHARLSTGIDEFDRVLGGGIVPGSLVLLGGEPGIGKSTLLLQAAANMARTIGPVLYSSGEESEHQIKSRGERLGVGDAPLYLLAETCLERILEEIARIRPALVIVDSIQTVFSLKFQSAPGSIGQVREAATQLLFTAKGQNVPTLLVGHVTKDGSLAGPKALEHVVDTVLYFEGERHHSHRVVRAVKNRFGAVSELGVFEMTVGRPSAGAEPVEAVSRRASVERARFGGAVFGRRLAADPGRSAGARQQQHVWQRPADGQRHRSAAAVAAAGGARETRRPEPDRRRRVRQRRRRDDRRRAGGGPRRRLPPLPPASGIASSPPTTAMFGEVGLPAKSAASRRRRCASGKPRRWGFAAASCPRPTSIRPTAAGRGVRARAGPQRR